MLPIRLRVWTRALTGSHPFVHAVDRGWLTVPFVRMQRYGSEIPFLCRRSAFPHSFLYLHLPIFMEDVGLTPAPSVLPPHYLHHFDTLLAFAALLMRQPMHTPCPAAALLGCRIGEAANPGPHRDTFRCAVLNPTALRGKVPELLSLDADLLCVSETSAVESVQKELKFAMRVEGYASYFGAPVPFHLTDAASDTAVRGQAGGVAIFTRVPSRPAVAPIAPATFLTTRIQECFTRIGAIETRIVCIYGVPESHANSRDTNDFLLNAALLRVQQSRVPAIVAGDLNCEVHALPAWQKFQQLGYVEAFAAIASQLGLNLEPTCKGSTYNDTALLAPQLVPLLQHAQVLTKQHLFDALASPVRFCCSKSTATHVALAASQAVEGFSV